MTRARAAILIGAVVAAMVGVGASPVGAAPIVVTTTADGGPGSLRDAFAQASVALEPTEIVLGEDLTYELDDCVEGDLSHTGTQPLTIRANGSAIIQMCPTGRVIATDGDLTVVDGTIAGGRLPAGIGGGIEADTADVTLIRSTLVDNEAPIGGGVAAIRVTLVESTVRGNTAGTVGGGIWADQVADLTNSTVTLNASGGSGGGITVVNSSVRLLHATVVENDAPSAPTSSCRPGPTT